MAANTIDQRTTPAEHTVSWENNKDTSTEAGPSQNTVTEKLKSETKEEERSRKNKDVRNSRNIDIERGEGLQHVKLSQLNKPSRLSFIRKVYLIFFTQLVITSLWMALFMYDLQLQEITRKNLVLNVTIGIVIAIIFLAILLCIPGLAKTEPWNMLVLFSFTTTQGVVLGMITSFYPEREILLAIGICAVVCFTLTLFTAQTAIDFTALNEIMATGVTVLIILIIVVMLYPVKILAMIYCGVGVFIFCVLFIIETQSIIGGKAHQYETDDYVIAALSLYINVINLLMYTLGLMRIIRS